ncbi:MAG: ABC transporter ATP-binding protein [Lachnospiraceae bacterium]|nr:ABC transporter ATP-binding protein [Lachnospiraceae bacterium]
MIEVKNLVKKYGDHVAVDHLSFTVERGQILGFLGPNGAGKSTTMNMITGYISATEGTVIINGHDIYDEPEEAKKSIGYLPELPPVYPDMTVREYLNFVADIKKVDRKRKDYMIKDAMKKTKVEDVSERLIKHLSKGYKQRVGLAQAILGYPEVIILDEPTVGLDPMQIIEIRDLIKDLAKEHTVILSSHILSEVSAVCDSVLIINKGKLVLQDAPDMISKHLNKKDGLHLVVKGAKADVDAAIAAVPGVIQREYEEAKEAGTVKVTVYSDSESDIREGIFYALSDAKCPIFDMQSTTMSLEDIFLEVTKEEPKKRRSKKKTAKEEN